MKYLIEGYNPKSLFQFFEDICHIPHGSGNEQEISNFLVAFAAARGLECEQDAFLNVIIKKKGSAGCENLPAIMLQGHMDMVCEKNNDCVHDFEHDPLNLVIKDGFLYADNTTLGADNGVAVALMMALLDDNTLVHPPLECVFTTEEETGLTGATNIDATKLSAKTMINLDSEDEGIATVSCAGGMRVNFSCNPNYKILTNPHLLTVEIGGLIGGHSGSDIGLERGNANKLMTRVLLRLQNHAEIRLVSLHGGNKDNAIPRECVACIAFSSELELKKAHATAFALLEQIKAECATNEPDFRFMLTSATQEKANAMSVDVTRRLIHTMTLGPNGVQKQNLKQGGFIVASLNMGVVHTNPDAVKLTFSPRSSEPSLQEELKERLLLLADTFGFDVEITGEYPGWSYAEHSPIRDAFCESFARLFGYELKTEAIHAGLECGLFCGKIKGLDAIAVGPDVFGCHTPEEKLDLGSLARTWTLLCDVLAQLTK